MVSSTFQVDADAGPYGVKLDIFEGPLDLLLFLIRKDEIDIYDIPVANITRQFLEYVEVIQSLDLELAGDFVLMAATLMKIKSRMLLPSDPEEEEPEDPREELVRRLLEYQQFKEAASWMEERQAAYRDTFYRGSAVDLSGIEELWSPAEAFRSVGLFDLLAAFKQALDAAPKIDFHQVAHVEVTTEERIEFILEALSRRGQVPFFDLVSGAIRMVVVVTFIAILELMKTGKIEARQADIWIYGREAEPSETDRVTESKRDV